MDPVLRGRLQEELLAALADSCLLEHVCRLRMALQEVPAAVLGLEENIASCDSIIYVLLSQLLPDFSLTHRCIQSRSPPLAPPQRAALRRVLSEPCLQLYLGWALAAPLSAAAGRPLYGLPPRLVPARGAAVAEGTGESAELVESAWVGCEVWGYLLHAARRERALHVSAVQTASTQRPLGALAVSPQAAAADQSEERSAGRLPYKLRHVVGLLMHAMRHGQPALAESRLHMRVLHSLGCFVMAAVPWVRPPTAAAWLAGLWPMLLRGLHDLSPDDLTSRASLMSRMLLASLEEPGARVAPPCSGAGASTQLTTPPSLRAALDAGLVPALERAMRAGAHAAVGSRKRAACSVPALLVEFMLRRPGVWPALLAHGPQAQVASLIITMRKVTELARHGISPWNFQMIALLEQAAAALQGRGSGCEAAAHGPAGTADAGQRGGCQSTITSTALGWAVVERYCRQLTANRGLSDFSNRAAADTGAGHGSLDVVDGPSWEHILHAGGCPPSGSPAAEQQRRLAVFAAAQWLPVLMTGCSDAAPSVRQPLVLSAYSPPRAYLVLHHWLMLAARECCAALDPGSCGEAPGSSGCGEGSTAAGGASTHSAEDAAAAAAHASWSELLWSTCAVPHAAGAARAAEAAAALPLLDLYELLVAAAPGLVARHLYPAGADLSRKVLELRDELVALLQRCKRHGLLAALQQIVELCADHEGRLPPGWRPPAPGLAAAAALSRPGSWRPLPPPCEVGAEALGLAGSCANSACTVLAGASEAEVGAAVACGKCGAARYCCVSCKRAHWRDGHQAECRG